MCPNSSIQQIFLSWRVWIRPILILIYALFVIIVLPLLIVNSLRDGFTKKDQLVLIGGLFVLTSLPISLWHIIQHVVHLTKPILQKPIIRILWMVPIYALNAWLSLLFPQHAMIMDSIRECYEAYVIYNFMAYLLNFLNLEMDLEASLEHKPSVNHMFPLCYMTPWIMGREFVHNCKHGILQYTVFRPITTLISAICEMNGVYGDGTFAANVAFPYIVAINNVSQCCAMYCLVLFYRATLTELRPMKPLPKFLCIKAVVFFSFFQGVIINFLVYFGYLKDVFVSEATDDYQSLAAKLQNFLICIEMFLAAIAHHYSFPHDPFHINIPHYNGSNGAWYSGFLAMLDISDFQQDVSDHFGVVGSSLSRRFRGRSMYHMTRGTESDYLISASSAPSLYQSGLSYSGNVTAVTNTKLPKGSGGYGAVASHPNDGINIVKQQKSEYSPKHGLPKSSNVFNFDNSERVYQRTQSDNNTSSKSDTNSTATGGGGGVPGGTGVSNSEAGINLIRKSDSSASDWLSTPTDEMLGIDVKGLENDRINYRDPKL